MTDDLSRLLGKYETASTEGLFSDLDQLTRDVTRLGEALQSNEHKPQAKKILVKILEATESRTKDLQKTLADQSLRMDQTQKMADACVAYLKRLSD